MSDEDFIAALQRIGDVQRTERSTLGWARARNRALESLGILLRWDSTLRRLSP
jgi:hypothetical protein